MSAQAAFAFAWNPAVGVPLLIAGAIVLALIWIFGQPKKEQGRRRVADAGGERREPTLGDGESLADDPFFRDFDRSETETSAQLPQQGELEVGLREELEKLGATLAGERGGGTMPLRPGSHAAAIVDALRTPDADTAMASSTSPAVTTAVKAPPRSQLGRRPAQPPVERIVTLFVVARGGLSFDGADLVVAAEKAGLEFGAMDIFHRLVDGKREHGPLFSVANMLKPGNFDLSRLEKLTTPGLSFFMTLPGPLPALDAWDAMLPTAQRMAELLDGMVLDDERNALGRQRIAHIRDDLRGWDRRHEGTEISFGR
jgi:cell division protein ZipA